jgi:hypothetical protein
VHNHLRIHGNEGATEPGRDGPGPVRDVNGYPSPVYPRVKTLLGCGYGGFSPPMGILVGDSFTHRV